MKPTYKLLSVSLFSLLFFNGCINYNEPYNEYLDACFSTSMNEYDVGESVYFSNCSSGADSYVWDFGDGTSSTQSNPAHEFQNSGTYQVKLTVYNPAGRSTASKIIYVTGSTDLDILVMYLGTPDPVSNCDVTLYPTLNDWINWTNPLISITTGTSGNVIFTGLEPREYFVEALRSASDTSFYANDYENPSSGVLIENQITYMDVYVEFLYSTKKDGTKEPRFVVRKTKITQKPSSDRIKWKNSVRKAVEN
jgi:PKD repeat protein